MMRSRIILLAACIAMLISCGCSGERKLPETDGTFERYTQDLVMHSELMGTDIKYSILLPESYVSDKDKSYPVVYMLHGLGDTHNSWNGKYLTANPKIKSLEAAGKISEMIYVFPEGFTTYYCNYYTGKYRYMDMFIEELVPHIDANFRTIPNREHRSITGYSMGGFGAMVLAEKHPETFLCSAPLSMSFRTDAQYMAESQSGWDGQWGKIFGGIGEPGYGRITDYYKEHCPFYQFTPENKATLSQVKWFFTCGDDEEQLLIANDTLHVQLRDNGYPHEFRVGNGAHTSSYWMEALGEVLPFFDHYMNGGQAWPESSWDPYTLQEVSPDQNGAIPSIAYTGAEPGTGVYFFHNGWDAKKVRDVMAVFFSTNTKDLFIFLPCDLTQKNVEEWIAHYEGTYPQNGHVAVGLEGSGAGILAKEAAFSRLVFVDTKLGDHIVANPDKKYFFTCTDESACYADMGALYRSCKRNGAEFQYRVINATGDADVLRCANKLKSYILY